MRHEKIIDFKIKRILKKHSKKPGKIAFDNKLVEDLLIDSLSFTVMTVDLEETFKINFSDYTLFTAKDLTVNELKNIVLSKLS